MSSCCNGSSAWSMMVAVAVGAGVTVAVMSGVGAWGEAGTINTPAGGDEVERAGQPDLQLDLQPDIQPGDLPDPMDVMNAMKEAGTPDEHHALLEAFVGHWTAHSVTTMVPGAPAEESTGHETNEMILGGRYLMTHHEGMFATMPFEGRGVMGYDKIQKKWVSVWIDSFSTMIGLSAGTYDPATRTWTMLAEITYPMGNTMQHKTLHTIVNDDKRTLTFFERSSDGEEWHQSMVINYTRN